MCRLTIAFAPAAEPTQEFLTDNAQKSCGDLAEFRYTTTYGMMYLTRPAGTKSMADLPARLGPLRDFAVGSRLVVDPGIGTEGPILSQRMDSVNLGRRNLSKVSPSALGSDLAMRREQHRGLSYRLHREDYDTKRKRCTSWILAEWMRLSVRPFSDCLLQVCESHLRLFCASRCGCLCL